MSKYNVSDSSKLANHIYDILNNANIENTNEVNFFRESISLRCEDDILEIANNINSDDINELSEAIGDNYLFKIAPIVKQSNISSLQQLAKLIDDANEMRYDWLYTEGTQLNPMEQKENEWFINRSQAAGIKNPSDMCDVIKILQNSKSDLIQKKTDEILNLKNVTYYNTVYTGDKSEDWFKELFDNGKKSDKKRYNAIPQIKHYIDIVHALQMDLNSMIEKNQYDPMIDEFYLYLEQQDEKATTIQQHYRSKIFHAYENEILRTINKEFVYSTYPANYQIKERYLLPDQERAFAKKYIQTHYLFNAMTIDLLKNLFSPYSHGKTTLIEESIFYQRDWDLFEEKFNKAYTLLKNEFTLFLGNLKIEEEYLQSYSTERKIMQFMRNTYYLNNFSFEFPLDLIQPHIKTEMAFPDKGNYNLKDISKLYCKINAIKDEATFYDKLKKFAKKDVYMASHLNSQNKYEFDHPLKVIAYYHFFNTKKKKEMRDLIVPEFKNPGDIDHKIINQYKYQSLKALGLYYAIIFPKQEYVNKIIELINSFHMQLEKMFSGDERKDQDPKIMSPDYQNNVLDHLQRVIYRIKYETSGCIIIEAR